MPIIDYSFMLTCLIVMGAKILEISIQSIKVVYMVKGQKLIAAGLAFIECMVWGLVVSSAITSLSSNIALLISYCFGYAAGVYIGTCIENKLAIGTSSIQLMIKEEHIKDVGKYLKDNNRGFTVLEGHGVKDKMYVIIIVLPRKDVKTVIKDISTITENQSFVVTSDVSKFTGGYGLRK